jgi:hypothetical protein
MHMHVQIKQGFIKKMQKFPNLPFSLDLNW